VAKTYIVLKGYFDKLSQERIVNYINDCGVDLLGRYVEVYKSKEPHMIHIKGRVQHDVFLHELYEKESMDV